MIVYTFQYPDFLQLPTKEIMSTPKYWDKNMITYYDWMYEQYQKRIGSYVKSLIWVWDTIPESYFEYDETDDTYWETEQSRPYRYRMLLTLDVPDERILWSDFEAWHCPLNNGALLSEIELEEEVQGKIFDKMYGWERIFNFEWLKVNRGGNMALKQGVVDRVNLASIKGIKYYDAKYKKIIDKKEIATL